MRDNEPSQGKMVDLPLYNDALGEFQKLSPDKEDLNISFEDVTEQIYPLRADIIQLRKFCREYLDISEQDRPDGLPAFEPAAPWVLMQVCNYGKMALKSQNIGWFSQHELAFGFPVMWYEVRNGRRVFKDWAMAYPFIYVDNPLSMSMGRQMYGWPKAGIEIKSPHPNPAPDAPQCLVSIELADGPERAVEYEHEHPRFLEIFQQRPLFSGGAGITDFLSFFPRAASASLSLAIGALGTVNRIFGYTGSSGPGDLNDIVALLNQISSSAASLYDSMAAFFSTALEMTLAQERIIRSSKVEQVASSGGASVRIVTRKQVRDAEYPQNACYSAIVGSTMRVNRIIDGGLLLPSILSPDPTGGIQIKLRDDDKVVEHLGIMPFGQETIADRNVDTLRPVAPFWAKVNLSYDRADYVCEWSAAEGRWRVRPRASER